MKFSDNAMSAILLCSHIGIEKNDQLKPLSLGEWNDFLERVIARSLEPSIVLRGDVSALSGLNYSDIQVRRISRLASRGGAVALELDSLSNKGIEVTTLFDSDYPTLLKRKLKRKTPPVLFYAGDIRLAKKIGIAVVGSRNVDGYGIEFARKLVKKAAEEKLVIYSGGARGVDTIAQNTAIENGGVVVSYIADSLSAIIKKKEVLDNLIQGKLLLISDVKPDVGFSAARAMNRNKYIYTSAYGAFVVTSDYNRGGTWTGAMENMRNHWTKLFAWNHMEYDGNRKLIEAGAVPFELSHEKIYDVITRKETSFDQMDMFKVISAVCEDPVRYHAGEEKV